MATDDAKSPELKIDSRAATGFVSFFNSLPDDPSVLRFFDRKDYYTAHGPAALFIARTYYKTSSVVRQLGSANESLPSVTVNRSMLETILRDLLLVRGDRSVELYEGSGASWRVSRSATPGRLEAFEEVLFSSAEMSDTPTVVGVMTSAREGERNVGLGFIDITKRTVGMVQFLDDDQFTNLESSLVALGCRECVLPQEGGKNSPDRKKLLDVLSRCNILLTQRKKAEFSGRDLEQDLGRLLKGSSSGHQMFAEAPSSLAAAALGAVLAYTEVLSGDENYGKFSLLPYSPNTHMRLDAAALRALNVLESRTDGNKNFSLSGLLNRTSTAGLGRRLLLRWLKQPLLDVDEIRCRHDAVEAFVSNGELRQIIRQHLRRIPDIERLTRKLETRRANLGDVVKLYQASVRLPFIHEALSNHGGSFVPFLKERFGDALAEWCGPDHLAKFEALVEAAVDLEAIENGEFLISASYDAGLGEIKAERDGVDREIQKVLQAAAGDLGLVVDKTLKLDKIAQAGHVFRITKKEEANVRKKLNAAYVTLETRKDGVKFTNAKLRRLSERHMALSDSYSSMQRDLVSKVVEVAATFVEVFESVASLLAQLDVLQGFAEVAATAPVPYVRPNITGPNEGNIILINSRHPCVEVQDDVNFIPNDCKLVRHKSWFQIITGPNMGGKSTFIRQVGVNVLMSQVGSFVACDSADISVRDAIFARVGAGDCQLRGVSTFMAEMLETAAILKAASSRSLVIIDELGRGTSTYDGFGLAWAICEHLVEVIRAPALFATHFHELTALANQTLPSTTPAGAQTESDTAANEAVPPENNGVANFHVRAHIDEASRKLTMLYKVEEGPCDQSFGIHVAEFAHFPPAVVKMAREKAAELEDFGGQGDEEREEGEGGERGGAGSEGDDDVGPEEKEVATGELQVGAKRKRVVGLDSSEGSAERAKRFLLEFKALPLPSMDPEEAVSKVKEMVAQFKRQSENRCGHVGD